MHHTFIYKNTHTHTHTAACLYISLVRIITERNNYTVSGGGEDGRRQS